MTFVVDKDDLTSFWRTGLFLSQGNSVVRDEGQITWLSFFFFLEEDISLAFV